MSEHTLLFKKKTLKQDVHSVTNNETELLALPIPAETNLPFYLSSLLGMSDTI